MAILHHGLESLRLRKPMPACMMSFAWPQLSQRIRAHAARSSMQRITPSNAAPSNRQRPRCITCATECHRRDAASLACLRAAMLVHHCAGRLWARRRPEPECSRGSLRRSGEAGLAPRRRAGRSGERREERDHRTKMNNSVVLMASKDTESVASS